MMLAVSTKYDHPYTVKYLDNRNKYLFWLSIN